MKSIKYILTACLAIASNIQAFMQTSNPSGVSANMTEMVKVSGNCDMCKARIEKAAKVEGLISAEWNKSTKVLTFTYDPSMVTSDAIQKSIAAAGHDTEKFKADNDVYEKLPACCHYERMK